MIALRKVLALITRKPKALPGQFLGPLTEAERFYIASIMSQDGK